MSFPERVTLELSNRCNRFCDGCPRQKMKYPLGDMSVTLFTKVTEQLDDDVVIVPFFRGEPTLNKHFIELMQKLGRFKTVQLATNADYLTKSIKKAILENCTFVSVSLHSYLLPHQTRLPSFFYDALGAGVETQISILDSQVGNHTKTFSRRWLNHVDRVRIYKTHSINGFGDMQGCPITDEPCNKPFEDMVVYWDGGVGLCNHDWNNLTPLGDLNSQPVTEVWTGSAYRWVRWHHGAGYRRMVETCKNCAFKPNHVYGELIKNG